MVEVTTERILVYDRAAALVPLDPQNTSRGALLAHKSGIVANIIALFEKIWDEAEDLAQVDAADGEDVGPGLSEIELRVLVLMCSVGKDEAGAREMGVSVRTYRRYVADLMEMLGAAGRAQTGEPPAARDDGGAARSGGQQRSHLVGVHHVVEDEERPVAGPAAAQGRRHLLGRLGRTARHPVRVERWVWRAGVRRCRSRP